MKAKSGILTMILFLLTAVHVLQAQQPPLSPNPTISEIKARRAESEAPKPEIFYRLDFAIREMDGEKLIDTRNYSLWVQSGVEDSVNAGSEVPYPAGTYSAPGSASTKNISYRSVGVSIDCYIKEVNESPMLRLRINISDALPPEKDSDTPVFRKITLNSMALLTLDKATTVSIVEDPGSRHRYQVDVTAKKLK